MLTADLPACRSQGGTKHRDVGHEDQNPTGAYGRSDALEAPGAAEPGLAKHRLEDGPPGRPTSSDHERTLRHPLDKRLARRPRSTGPAERLGDVPGDHLDLGVTEPPHRPACPTCGKADPQRVVQPPTRPQRQPFSVVRRRGQDRDRHRRLAGQRGRHPYLDVRVAVHDGSPGGEEPRGDGRIVDPKTGCGRREGRDHPAVAVGCGLGPAPPEPARERVCGPPELRELHGRPGT
jgi:hypothetical protein